MSNHAVDNGVLNHVSPSQIKTYLTCPRKWYYLKVLRLREPETNAQGLGTSIHTEMEKWFEHGILPTYPSAIMAVRLAVVPKSHPTVLIEEPRDYKTGLEINGVAIQARADLIHTFEDKESSSETIDWKSRGSGRGYESPESLATDPQGIIYSKYVIDNIPECDRTRFRHVYIRTDCFDADSRASDWLSRDEVEGLFSDLIRPVVLDMQIAAAQPTPETVEANNKKCFMYGKPCFYADKCTATSVRKSEPRVLDDLLDDVVDDLLD